MLIVPVPLPIQVPGAEAGLGGSVPVGDAGLAVGPVCEDKGLAVGPGKLAGFIPPSPQPHIAGLTLEGLVRQVLDFRLLLRGGHRGQMPALLPGDGVGLVPADILAHHGIIGCRPGGGPGR